LEFGKNFVVTWKTKTTPVTPTVFLLGGIVYYIFPLKNAEKHGSKIMCIKKNKITYVQSSKFKKKK
jgi:hypothetical protein